MSERSNQVAREWRRANPAKSKRNAVKYFKRWCERHPEEHLKRNREYQKKWLSDPTNKRIHDINASLCQSVRYAIKHKRERSKISCESLAAYDMMLGQRNKVISHIVAIRHFVMFDSDISTVIINDALNIEAVTSRKNSSLRNWIDARVIETAKLLEKKFPKELFGFVEYLQKVQPQYKGIA
jgi:ribosome-binding protein aMBF1 (putative translation factor)